MRVSSRNLVSVALVVATALSLLLPWYPLVVSHVETHTFAYTYTIQTISYEEGSKQLFSMHSITLGGYYASEWRKNLGTFYAESGWVVTVSVSMDSTCQRYCGVSVDEDWGDMFSVFYVDTTGEGSFIAPQSGNYRVYASSVGWLVSYDIIGKVYEVSISATWSKPHPIPESKQGENAVDVTKYDVTYVSPISLGRPEIVGVPIILLALAISGLVLIGRKPATAVVSEAPIPPTPPEVVVPAPPITTMFCRECGAKIPRDSKFCKECGTELA